MVLLAATLWPTCCLAAEISGERVYREKCAQCHGVDGAGTKQNKKRLEGGLSVAQLAEVIGETMPEDAPGSLAPAESQAVAAYVHGAFYSEIARARRAPARIELARLTVRQYRQALSDLIGSFRPALTFGEQRGLNGEYYSGRRIGGRRGRATKRLDSQVDFNFGREAPVEQIAEPREFSIRWTGSVQAAETGEYEFVIRTEHAARLWVNDNRQPLIDAWVKSGDDTEYQGSLFLLGGRVYPLRLEFTKAKQGVDDSKKQKKKPPSAPASIALLWRRPQGVLAPIPSRRLAPDTGSESFVCATPFPPDDRSYGWERGVSISKAWDQATTDAAIDAAGYVTEKLNELAKTRGGDSDRDQKLRRFCREFVERAFRRPLNDKQAAIYIDRQFDEAGKAETAVKRVVLLSLKSPRFLFREVSGDDAYDVAARLSFGLWDSLPDDELLNAARDGQLRSTEQVAQQAERMLNDPRAKPSCAISC